MNALAVFPAALSVASAQLNALGNGFVLVSWERDQADAPGRIVPTISGEEVRPPYTTLGVRTCWGGRRMLMILRAPDGAQHNATIQLASHGRLVAETFARAGAPDLDVSLLLGGLDATARLRIVRFFFDFARSTPALRSDAGFAAVCRRLVLELSPAPSPLVARATATDDLVLCEGTLSAGFGEVAGTYVLTPSAVRAASFDLHTGGANRRGRVPLHVLADRTHCASSNTFVLIGSKGLALRTFGGVPAALPTLAEHLSTRGNADLPLRHYVLRCLAERGRTDAAAAAAVRELQVLVPLPRRRITDTSRAIGAAIDAAVPTGDGGLFLSGWLHDPHGLTGALRVFTPFGGERRLDGFEHRFPRESVAKLFGTKSSGRGAGDRSGFVAYLPGEPDPAPALQMHAELQLGSGGAITLVPPPRPQAPAEARAAVLGSLPPAFATPAVIEQVIAPAVAPLHAAHMATRGAPEMVVFGQRPERPAVSVIVPLYRTLEFLRFQLAAFAADPGMDAAELIFVLDSPEQRDELVHALRGFHALYGQAMVLLVQTDNYGYSAANNAGAAAARAGRLLFLNSDVVPDQPGWLPRLVEALHERAGTGAVGPKLLFGDDSLQHAGLYFDRDLNGRWYNHHFYKGMPRDFAPACKPRSVPGVTGACLLTPRSAFEAAGGFCEDYIIGDYEDSDLCLRLRSAGRDIRYVPSVELYHLERRSITRHRGYTRGVASEYNAWLHACRWGALIEELAARNWDAEAPPAKTRFNKRKQA
ncbi:MAG TPA: glycosyltransferase [Azospirillum sp.]|nr:glycosyltransferase [Azospirillum sp.]